MYKLASSGRWLPVQANNELGGREFREMTRMKTIASALLSAAIACAANAQRSLPAAVISATNSSAGSIQLTLFWQANGSCGPLIPRNPPVITISGNEVQIVSVNEFFDCSPPPLPSPPTTTASIVADVGMLPDGTYSVVWSFPTPYPHAALAPVAAKFDVVSGFASPVAIPVAPVVALAVALGLALIGFRSL
jgi:hypothetical protein